RFIAAVRFQVFGFGVDTVERSNCPLYRGLKLSTQRVDCAPPLHRRGHSTGVSRSVSLNGRLMAWLPRPRSEQPAYRVWSPLPSSRQPTGARVLVDAVLPNIPHIPGHAWRSVLDKEPRCGVSMRASCTQSAC